MVMIISGLVLISFASALDSIFRARMARIGYKWALLQGGIFNYSKYSKERKRHGWSAWPVHLMWASLVCGLALLIVGFFLQFGASSAHHP